MAWDLIGHAWAEKMLQQHIASGQVRHAYLFTGPSGVGRRTLALHFAQAINCSQPTAPGVPCGVCRSCTQIERMQHPDLTILQSETTGGVLKVEQVRDLQHQLSLAPYEASFRIALLLRFEEANDSAQNALLKTLEEPNEKVILLLTADLAENLLPTIASRCELLHLRSTTLDELTNALIQHEGLEERQARLLAHLSSGRPGYALHLLREAHLMESRRSWLEDGLQLMQASRRERFAYSDGKFYGRDERNEVKDALREALTTWLSFWRDVLLVTSGAKVPLTNLDYEAQIIYIAGQVNLSTARKVVQSLEASIPRLNNANLRLKADALLLEWPRIHLA